MNRARKSAVFRLLVWRIIFRKHSSIQVYLTGSNNSSFPSLFHEAEVIESNGADSERLHVNSKRRYRETQKLVFNFLEKPFQRIISITGFYHMLGFLSVIVCLVVTIFSTIDGYEEKSMEVLFYLESVILGERCSDGTFQNVTSVQYTVEYILRIWSCGCHGRFKGYMGRLKFARRFFSVLDLTTLLITALVFFESLYMSAKNEEKSESRLLATSVLRALRFLQVVRMIRVDRR